MMNDKLARIGSTVAIGAFAVLAACSPRDDTAVVDSAAGATAASVDSAVSTAGSGTMTDANIFSALTTANAAEVEAGKEAATKATDADVKAFAQMMVTDHQAMLDKGNELARTLNIVPVAGETAEDVREDSKDAAEDLKDEAGRDFNDEYIEKQIDAHENTLELLDRANNSTANADIKALIAEARPKVQAHLDRAKQIKDKID